MAISFSLPIPGKHKKQAKDMIVSELALEHPLTTAQLFRRLNKRYNADVTYQAVRKAILNLESEGVLGKAGKGYEISRKWILDARNFVDTLQKRYLEHWKPLEKAEVGSDVVVYTVKTLNEVERLWGEILFDWIKKLEKGKTYLNTFQTPHIWIALGSLQWEWGQMYTMKEKGVKSYAMIYSDTFLDKITLKFYKDIGVLTKVKKDRTYARNCEIGTYGDMIIQCYWPENIAREFDNYFNKIKSVRDLKLEELAKISNKQADIKVTVMNNPQLARQIQEFFLKEFGEKK